MRDKKTFFEEIGPETIFDDGFFKKVYGYSVCDKEFLVIINRKLIQINRKDIIQAYNAWYEDWKVQDDQRMKSAARWLIEAIDNQYNIPTSKFNVKEMKKEWKQGDLLQTKKELLLKKKLLLLNGK